MDNTSPRLLDQLRSACRLRHFSRRTEEAYCHWTRRFIVFHGKRHPSALAGPEVTQFLTSLANDHRVSASTQNQALCALLFLYRIVLKCPLPDNLEVPRVRTPPRLPVVLTRTEVRAVMAQLHGVPHLVASLLYGAGLRLLECLELRVKDIDLERSEIIVRQRKGRKDRITVLPTSVAPALRTHLADVQGLHVRDLAAGFGRVTMPEALARKYPNAATSWPWQFAFPAARVCRDPSPFR
jgi:integron integrase